LEQRHRLQVTAKALERDTQMPQDSDPSVSDHVQLSAEVAEALMTAIGHSARALDDSATDELRKLAEAYSLVRSSMPKPRGRGGALR
jgi:hypothetical protein